MSERAPFCDMSIIPNSARSLAALSLPLMEPPVLERETNQHLKGHSERVINVSMK